MHTEANLTSNGQMSMYDHYFSNFGRPLVPNDLCRFSHKASSVLENKIFTIYGHGYHLGQWMAIILAIFHSPAQGGLQMKFERYWPRGSRGGRLKISTFLPYTCIGKQI